jgi:hypothetical protein
MRVLRFFAYDLKESGFKLASRTVLFLLRPCARAALGTNAEAAVGSSPRGHS